MKKLLAYILTLMMILSGFAALAENAGDSLVVGSTTALSGSFFTDMWGSNASDIDVRLLLHGYNLMEWKGASGEYAFDESVVANVKTSGQNGTRTYTITLQDDLFYSDGTAVTAADYAFSILLGAAPEMAAIGVQTTSSDSIVGVQAYKNGAAKTISGVRILDADTIAVTVEDAYTPYFYEQALLNYNPYPIHVIAPGCKVADDGEGVYICNIDAEIAEPIFTAELLAETILNAEDGYLSHPGVVSGPYTLVSFDPNSGTAEFAVNEYFKGNSAGEKPAIERITFRTVENAAMIAQLESGEVDLINRVSNQEAINAGVALLDANEAFASESYLRSGYSFVSFSTERAAVSSKAVRQAIAYSMDKQALIEDTVGVYGEAVHGHYGVGQWVYQLAEGIIDPLVDKPVSGASKTMLSDYKKELAKWDGLGLDNVKQYGLDLAAAEELLVADGWTLNLSGEAFDPAKDSIRCKKIDGAIVPLQLSLIYPEGNAAGEYLRNEFAANLAKIGVELTVEAKPFAELLQVYYRQAERNVDMIYLASNFDIVYDPAETFNPADAYQGVNNRTAITDEKLYQLALELRSTESGDLLTYCRRWIALQEYYSEVLPTLPVYSNRYVDFYSAELKNYTPAADISWAREIVGAYIEAE